MANGTKANYLPAPPALAGRIVLGGSVSRLRTEVVQPIHRVHGQFVHVAALQDAQRNVASSGTAAPELAVELRLRMHGIAADGQDDVSRANARAIGRSLGRHARDQETPLHLVGRD